MRWARVKNEALESGGGIVAALQEDREVRPQMRGEKEGVAIYGKHERMYSQMVSSLSDNFSSVRERLHERQARLEMGLDRLTGQGRYVGR